MKKFAFTIRKTKNPKTVTQKSYYDFINTGLFTFREKGYAPELTLKFEKKGGLHVHGILNYDPELGCVGPYKEPRNKDHAYRMFRPRKGFHIKVEDIYDFDGWLSYITKEELDNKAKSYTIKDCLKDQRKDIEKFLKYYKNLRKTKKLIF